MKQLPVNKQSVIAKLDEIQRCMGKLTQFTTMPLNEFRTGENFAIAEHSLRRSLEAVFEIGAYILSRLPGGKPSGYKDIARKLGENKVVSPEFATDKLIKMAGYRNRLIHFYHEITVDEMHYIIQNNLKDFDGYSNYIKDVLAHSEKYGFKEKNKR